MRFIDFDSVDSVQYTYLLSCPIYFICIVLLVVWLFIVFPFGGSQSFLVELVAFVH